MAKATTTADAMITASGDDAAPSLPSDERAAADDAPSKAESEAASVGHGMSAYEPKPQKRQSGLTPPAAQPLPPHGSLACESGSQRASK